MSEIRAPAPPTSSRPVRLGRLWLLVPLAALVLAGCGGGGSAHTAANNCATRAGYSGNATDTGSAAATSSVIDVDARDFAFHPTCVTSVPSGTVTLRVHNVGNTLHNVSVAAQHIDRDVRPGATVTIEIKVGNAPVIYVCKYHKALGMVGVLEPASAG